MNNKELDLIAERRILDGKVRIDYFYLIQDSINTRILRVGLCGAPNSGKSTLLNTLVGKKISAVSHKVNTTRLEIVGIKNLDNTQIIYHDTPGILQKR